MPFQSNAQRKWMYANKPKTARKWQKETSEKNLPERKKTNNKPKS
tara:strand:- start:385 stop:519 length:135 start_codon:yes stop_codon:yes gene_type:complete